MIHLKDLFDSTQNERNNLIIEIDSSYSFYSFLSGKLQNLRLFIAGLALIDL